VIKVVDFESCKKCQFFVITSSNVSYCKANGLQIDMMQECPLCTQIRNLTDEESEIYDSWISAKSVDTGIKLF